MKTRGISSQCKKWSRQTALRVVGMHANKQATEDDIGNTDTTIQTETKTNNTQSDKQAATLQLIILDTGTKSLKTQRREIRPQVLCE